MPLTTFSDISFVLSGGATNINPNASLGGESSSSPIVDLAVNNLFNDVSPDDTDEGIEDYRCFYICNDGPTAIYDVKLWIASEYEGGATVALGIDTKDEIQRLTIGSASILSGSLTLAYNGEPFVVNHNGSLNVWANNFQQAVNSLAALEDVTVLGQYAGSSTVFDITFSNRDGRRSHPDIEILNNDLVPATSVSIASIQAGSPINTVAADIGIATNPPGGVSFSTPSESAPLTVPRLDPEDCIPVWVRRTVAPGATAAAQDGFTFRFSAASLGT